MQVVYAIAADLSAHCVPRRLDSLCLVSFGAGILFADLLNNIQLGGYPLGFWFAQQGSIYIFIALIFYYGRKMGQIDRQFDVEEK